ncbi:hypothetical protein ACJMK2_023714 [Sinanodonta woodiana]|uniref:Mab-21-like HhH/H2TH-like domain-containing protein n=1 Tax=Sinanodonta woodiana TaxID=1069815 RepID=A0ABD3T542_SINWO
MASDKKQTGLTGIDKVSNIPYLHMSFVFHSFVPMRYVRRQCPFDDPTFTGNSAEGYRLPQMFRLDENGSLQWKKMADDEVYCMMVAQEVVGPQDAKSPQDYSCIADREHTTPGFTRLKMIQQIRQAKSAPVPHLTREKSTMMLNKEVSSRGNSSKHYLQKQTRQASQDEEDESEHLSKLTRRAMSSRVSKTLKPAPKPRLSDDVHYALALKCPFWPDEAKEWKTRNRPSGWPGKRVEIKVVTSSCHVTPGADSESEEPDIEWTFTFFEAERILSKEAISSAHRQCFIVFCMLCLDLLETGPLLYIHMKYVFYFLCEYIEPNIWRNNPGHAVMLLLEKLLQFIQEKNLPDYFISQRNTIKHWDKEDFTRTEHILTTVRKNPVECLLGFSDSFVIYDVFPFSGHVRQIFKPLLEDAQAIVKHQDVEKSVKACMQVVDELCNSFYLDFGFDDFVDHMMEVSYYIPAMINYGILAFEEFIEHFIKPLLGDSEADKQLQNLPLHLCQKNIALSDLIPATEIWRPIRMCVLLISKFASDKKGSDFYDHLGCMYHAASTTYEEHRKEALEKAEEAFKEAVKRDDCGIGTYVDYGRFLCMTGQHEQSISFLKRVIKKEGKKPTSTNYYGKMETSVTEDFIKKEIEENNGLEVLSAAYAFYLLVECFLAQQKQEELTKTLQQFAEMCNTSKDPKSHSLLGYCLIKVKRYSGAMAEFKKTLALDPNDKVAHYAVNFCRKMEKGEGGAESSNGEDHKLHRQGAQLNMKN